MVIIVHSVLLSPLVVVSFKAAGVLSLPVILKIFLEAILFLLQKVYWHIPCSH